jgi:CubicO group peptidase (beta-lactamase class C family)
VELQQYRLALLGFVIRRVTGRFYGDYLRERVFEPLGMRSARVISESDMRTGDSLTVLVAVLGLALIAFAAILIATRGAARTDPSVALRAD